MSANLNVIENNEMPKARDNAPYKVLARKYRPSKLSELIGQELLVKILTNAIESGRMPHAFILTGIRGTGKTTTARIIARSLNCLQSDSPTIEPCGACSSCVSLSEDRHIDVIEIDAASRTGVDDMREIIESARYKPVSSRYKIYIIDEVHMLSKSAFNALLKTLEEPSPHVKFIFATTEINKVPITILSRCIRFDLKRISIQELSDHYKNICSQESIKIEDEAIRLIAHAADGSVRDGMSLLEQAISQNGSSDVTITAAEVRSMLGMVERRSIMPLFQAVVSGDRAASLESFRKIWMAGADPKEVLIGLMDICHKLNTIKCDIKNLENPDIAEEFRNEFKEIAEQISVPQISRMWQMLAKGYEEMTYAPDLTQATEMLLIRLAHTANYPSIDDILKELKAVEVPQKKKS